MSVIINKGNGTMNVKSAFTSKEVTKLTGVSYRQLDHWDRIGFITPSVLTASGKGSGRLYSFRDVLNIRVAKQLRDAGASIKNIIKSIEFIKQYSPEKESSLSDYMFITDGQKIFVLTEDPQVMMDTLRDGQLCWNVNMKKVEQEIAGILMSENKHGLETAKTDML